MLASASGSCLSCRPAAQEIVRESLHPHNVKACMSIVSKKFRGIVPSTRRNRLSGSHFYRQPSLQFPVDFFHLKGPNSKANVAMASISSGRPASNSNIVSEFASLTTSTQAPSPSPPSASDSYPGSPLLWVGVGVALCVFVTKAVDWLKKRLMQLAMEQMMSQMGPKGSPSPFGPSTPFPGFPPSSSPYPPPYTPSSPFTPSPPPPPPPPSTRREEPVSSSTRSSTLTSEKSNSPPREAAVFVDVDPKSTPSPLSPSPSPSSSTSPSSPSSPSSSSSSSSKKTESEPKKRFFQDAEVVEDAANAWSGWSGYTSTNTSTNGSGKAGDSGRVTIEQLEQMLETPAIQNLVLQYVPEYMRNPDTIKWLLKNPEIRQKIEDQLAGLSEGEYGNQMADMLKQFDLNNPELTKQFETMGVTPEQAVQTIMANPEVAMAFQNPKIQMAIMECAQNPANQLKYINDKEVMDVFEKISRLFPQTMQG